LKNQYNFLGNKKALYAGLAKRAFLLGWGGWIRTNEMADPKSAALPLGYTPMKVVERTGFEPVKAVPADLQSAPFGQLGNLSKNWSRRWDSNPQPADYKSAALPIELRRHVAELTGIEPAIFGVTGRHVNRYTTAPQMVTRRGFEPLLPA
jgi:hypothetical protein